MSRILRLAALALLLVTALATFASADGTVGPAGFPYSIIGLGSTQAAACTAAYNAVASHCPIHGTITTTPLGCMRIYDIHGEYLGTICRCEAATGWCQLFGSPGLP